MAHTFNHLGEAVLALQNEEQGEVRTAAFDWIIDRWRRVEDLDPSMVREVYIEPLAEEAGRRGLPAEIRDRLFSMLPSTVSHDAEEWSSSDQVAWVLVHNRSATPDELVRLVPFLHVTAAHRLLEHPQAVDVAEPLALALSDDAFYRVLMDGPDLDISERILLALMKRPDIDELHAAAMVHFNQAGPTLWTEAIRKTPSSALVNAFLNHAAAEPWTDDGVFEFLMARREPGALLWSLDLVEGEAYCERIEWLAEVDPDAAAWVFLENAPEGMRISPSAAAKMLEADSSQVRTQLITRLSEVLPDASGPLPAREPGR